MVRRASIRAARCVSTKDSQMTDESEPKPKARRGFAAMDPELRREISRKGGASVAPQNRSFSRDRDLASNSGRKGGSTSKGRRTAGDQMSEPVYVVWEGATRFPSDLLQMRWALDHYRTCAKSPDEHIRDRYSYLVSETEAAIAKLETAQ